MISPLPVFTIGSFILKIDWILYAISVSVSSSYSLEEPRILSILGGVKLRAAFGKHRKWIAWCLKQRLEWLRSRSVLNPCPVEFGRYVLINENDLGRKVLNTIPRKHKIQETSSSSCSAAEEDPLSRYLITAFRSIWNLVPTSSSLSSWETNHLWHKRLS